MFLVQLAEECGALERATEALQSLRLASLPEWLEASWLPLRIGSAVGFSLAYLLGLYSIMHVAAAYKRFSRQVGLLSPFLPCGAGASPGLLKEPCMHGQTRFVVGLAVVWTVTCDACVVRERWMCDASGLVLRAASFSCIACSDLILTAYTV